MFGVPSSFRGNKRGGGNFEWFTNKCLSNQLKIQTFNKWKNQAQTLQWHNIGDLMIQKMLLQYLPQTLANWLGAVWAFGDIYLSGRVSSISTGWRILKSYLVLLKLRKIIQNLNIRPQGITFLLNHM